DPDDVWPPQKLAEAQYVGEVGVADPAPFLDDQTPRKHDATSVADTAKRDFQKSDEQRRQRRPLSFTPVLGARDHSPPRLHDDALMRSPHADRHDGRVVHSLNSDVDGLAVGRRVWSSEHLPLATGISEPVADLELHGEEASCSGRSRVELL